MLSYIHYCMTIDNMQVLDVDERNTISKRPASNVNMGLTVCIVFCVVHVIMGMTTVCTPA